MKNAISFLLLWLMINSSFAQLKSPICLQYDKLQNPEVAGSCTFNYQPGSFEDGVAFTGTIDWKLKGKTFMIGRFTAQVIGSDAWIDGVSYSRSKLGDEVFSKIKPYTLTSEQWLQKGVIHFDVFVAGVYRKTIILHSINYMDNNYCDAFKNDFSEDEKCELFVKGFTMKISRVKNMSFAGMSDAKKAIDNINKKKEYDVFVQKADDLFNQKRYEDAKNNYKSALNLLEDEYPRMKIKEINEIIFKEANQKKYNAIIKEGDANTQKKDYQGALNKYDEAGKILQDDKRANDKSRTIRELIKKQEEEKRIAEEREKSEAAEAQVKSQEETELQLKEEEDNKIAELNRIADEEKRKIDQKTADDQRIAEEAKREEEVRKEEERFANQEIVMSTYILYAITDYAESYSNCVDAGDKFKYRNNTNTLTGELLIQWRNYLKSRYGQNFIDKMKSGILYRNDAIDMQSFTDCEENMKEIQKKVDQNLEHKRMVIETGFKYQATGIKRVEAPTQTYQNTPVNPNISEGEAMRNLQLEQYRKENEITKEFVDGVGKASAELGASIYDMIEEARIKKEQARAAENKRKQKENEINNIKDDLIGKWEKNKRLWNKIAADEYSEGAEKYELDMVAYCKCCIAYINLYFSYNNMDWTRPDCKEPEKILSAQPKTMTANDFYIVAKRKALVPDPDFKESSLNYINKAIEINSKNADYYYFKSTLVEKEEDEILLLKKVTDLDPKNLAVKQEYDFRSARKDFTLSGINNFINAYPASTYMSEAKSIKNYLEDLVKLDELIAKKLYLEAEALNTEMRKHPLYSRSHIKEIKKMDKEVEDIYFKKAVDNDHAGIKLRTRIDYYRDYLTRYPLGMHKDTANRRLDLLNMRLNGYYLSLSIAPIAGSFHKKTNEYYKFSTEFLPKQGSDPGVYEGWYTHEATCDYFMAGYAFSLDQYTLLFKSQTTNFPRIDLEIFGDYNYSRSINFGDSLQNRGNPNSREDDNPLVMDYLDKLNAGPGTNFWVWHYDEYLTVVNQDYEPDKIHDLNSNSTLNIGAQLWIGKVFGLFYMKSTSTFKRKISLDLPDGNTVPYEKSIVVNKYVPGASIAFYNSNRGILKISYCQLISKTDDSDIRLHKFEFSGNTNLSSRKYPFFLGFSYDLSLYSNKIHLPVYDYKSFALHNFLITFGIRFQ